MRINLMMPDKLVAEIDAEADALNISRSAYICMACSQVLQESMIERVSLRDMYNFFKKVQKFEEEEGEGTFSDER